ncbi:MAG: hypothetical protein ACREBE_25270 [bacterium]
MSPVAKGRAPFQISHLLVDDNLNRFKCSSGSQTGGVRHPNWIATYDIEPGDSGSSFVRDSDAASSRSSRPR